MKGYRSILAQVPTIIFAVLAFFGVIVPDADQAILVGAASSVTAVVMRLVTTTKIGESQ